MKAVHSSTLSKEDGSPRTSTGRRGTSRVKQIAASIAAKWKMFQRRASASFRDDAKKAAAPAPGRRGV